MSGEECVLQLIDCALDGEGLLEDIDAIGVILDHLADTLQVPFNRREAIEHILLICLHVAFSSGSPTPWGGGLKGSVPGLDQGINVLAFRGGQRDESHGGLDKSSPRGLRWPPVECQVRSGIK